MPLRPATTVRPAPQGRLVHALTLVEHEAGNRAEPLLSACERPDLRHPEPRLGVPIVLLDNRFPTKSLDSVVIDNTWGAWSAVHYLTGMGHRDIGYLHSTTEIRNFLERQEGYLSAMRSTGTMDVDPMHTIVSVGSTVESAYADMSAYLDEDPYLPTAYFADNDIIASSCIRALEDHGYSVPEDISVVGHLGCGV